MTCPCKDCLCIPICSNKLYFTLLSDCFLLQKYINTSDDGHTLRAAQNILHPKWWKSKKNINQLQYVLVKQVSITEPNENKEKPKPKLNIVTLDKK